MAEKPNIDELKAAAKAKAAKIKKDIAAKKAADKMPEYYVMPEQTGDVEKDSEADLTEIQAGFRKRAKDEGKRFEQATDTEYWFANCFQTREQRECFINAVIALLVEKGISHAEASARLGDKYVDGRLVAYAFGIELPSADVPYNTSSKINSAWTEFVE